MKREPQNPVLSAREIILTLLQSAKEAGATAKELAAAGHIPIGTASSSLTTLAYSGDVGCLNIGEKPRRYALLKHGGVKWDPKQEAHSHLNGASRQRSMPAGAAEIRVVVSVGSDRKSMNYDEAKALYRQLEPLFRKR